MPQRLRFRKVLLTSNKMFSDSVIYLLATIAASIPAYLLLPVLSAYIPPNDFAEIGIYQAFYTCFLVITGMYVGGSVVRESYNSTQKQIQQYIFNAALLGLITLFIYTLLIFLTREHFLFLSSYPSRIIYVALIAAFAQFYINLILGQLQVKKKPLSFGLIQVCLSVLNVTLSLFFVINLDLSSDGRIYGIALSHALVCLPVCIVLFWKPKNKLSFKPDYISVMLRYGVPAIPHGLGTFFLNWFPAVLATAYVAKNDLGIYVFCFNVSMLIGVIGDSINRAFTPWLYEKMSAGTWSETHQQIIRVSVQVALLLLLMSIFYYASCRYLFENIFSIQYKEGLSFMSYLIIGQFLGAIYLLLAGHILFRRKTGVMSIITVTSVLSNVSFIMLFIDNLGINAVVFGFVISRFIMVVLTFIVSIFITKKLRS